MEREKNPNKTPHQNPNSHHRQHLPPRGHPMDNHPSSDPPLPSDASQQPSFYPEIVVFRDSDSSDSDAPNPNPAATAATAAKPSSGSPRAAAAYVNPEPHISSQFYTFNRESHSLMVRCILERRLASPEEIRRATPRAVLRSWRLVWKDRNEDTAYVTAWKRIQDKLNAHVDAHGNQILYFKNNSQQYVSHVEQWQDIVMSFHGDADLRHLGLKDTVERIKQVWTVGAKFYGIPESFIRVCVAACPVCSDTSSGGAGAGAAGQRTKRRRFEYTESFDVPARDVPQKLQQLAAKHKVVLCIRQKYIRYKPFMAEVKDYACHRAGEPASVAAAKKPRALKREPYASKRCGCGFRIRAIVPIANYNEKDKTFVYQEEGMAVFKLYAVHSGHEPGPLDGNARIIHRVVGHKPGFDQDTVYGIEGDVESDGFGLMGKDESDLQLTVLQQVQELQAELGAVEGKVTKLPREMLSLMSRELSDILNRVRSMSEDASRSIGEEATRSSGLLLEKQHSDEVLVDGGLAHWVDPHHDQIYGDGKEPELMDDEEDAFERSLGDIPPWDRCRDRKDLMRDHSKSDKWLKDFDEKSILNCEDSKLIKPMRHDGTIVTDASLVGMQVDSFYPENPKWYDSPCGLDTGADCGDGAFRHGEIV